MRKKFAVSKLLLLLFMIVFLPRASTKAFADNVSKKEIEAIGKITAESFSYYKSKSLAAKNYHTSQNEIEGQCGDYALRFAVLWNQKYPDNPAELIVVEHVRDWIKPGVYEVVGKRDDFNPEWWFFRTSGFVEYKNGNGEDFFGIYHPDPAIGFYHLKHVADYPVKRHYGDDMTDQYVSHVWVKIGDTIVDPTYADTGNRAFIGRDELEKD